ncbi:YggS family pyridoxal phosphate-dependent enzyme [Chelatococcus asaccharovorans]|uniref:YggS family pyridoxal phosphate-dependent enzyme n=1 Tax=Chelatococcus asaccharovorans TaxID=28210 RepID=UPI00224C69B4|nr:YggS family pyridoxal phosphate-dependent enzyme [Chelatococcus asaccharovorans]CAH1657919.1 Pyridoxal phosphate homeostasis protein [Chelatococcus asaccharovorans]CAH1684653.1 Pyridoxal phosphate homeostasis protein [Chelatococcus asaccharovorans]
MASASSTDTHSGNEAAGRLAAVRDAIARTAREEGRAPGDVTLVAVSKTFPADDILPVLEAGQRVFGENRVQEAKAKWPALRERYPDVELHLIGPLQSNKAREAVALFDVIHTVDRESLAAALAKEIPREEAATGRRPRLLVEVNTGLEPQKAGIAPAELGAFLARLRDHHGLKIEGLMCIPPADEPPSPHFALLAKLAHDHGLPLLSMGMSGDFEQAVMLGATHVRVGSAIFGHRPPL